MIPFITDSVWAQSFLFLCSLAMLYFGANLALDGAERIGKMLHLSNLVIGLVIIGFGTSLPELFVSQVAAFRQEYPIALGNIVGSNITNLLFILGVCGLLAKIPMGAKAINEQMFFHVLATIIFGVALVLPTFDWRSGLVLLIFFGVYLGFTFHRMGKLATAELAVVAHLPPDISTPVPLYKILGKLVLGFWLLYKGSALLMNASIFLGNFWHVPSYVMGVIVVAFGTSLPELITSLLASYQKRDLDLIVGNIVGSNIFNGAFILGSLGIYHFPIPQNFAMEIGLLLFLGLVMMLLSLRNISFQRRHGIAFLLLYLGVVIYWSRGSF